MASETFTLELVSPAFLAGADQSSAESCELRVPTLRGQLRWWWRTLHAAHVDVPTLRRLEAAVWGSTDAASPVRLSLTPVNEPTRKLFDHKDGFKPKLDFKKAHNLAQPPNNKTTQGLFYLAYGMDENVRNERTGQTERRRRYYLEPGAQWELHLGIQPDRKPVDGVPAREVGAALIKDQVLAALSLLCRYGGVGSKARKGFGSLGTFEANIDDKECHDKALALREACLPPDFRPPLRIETPALKLDHADFEAVIGLDTTDPWNALDQLGFVVQGYAQGYAHKPEKVALGLPRKIHGPRSDRAMPGQVNWQRPEWLGRSHHHRPKDTRAEAFRQAAPVHYHLGKGNNGTLLVRVIAFPSSVLPDEGTSDTVLKGLLAHIAANLGPGTTAPTVGAPSAVAGRQPPAGAPTLRFRKGQRVRVGEEAAAVLEDVTVASKRMDVDFGDGDIDSVNPKDCQPLD